MKTLLPLALITFGGGGAQTRRGPTANAAGVAGLEAVSARQDTGLPAEPEPPPNYQHPVDVAQFQQLARRLVDFVGDYHRGLAARPPSRPVQPAVQPGFLSALLPDAPPEEPEPLEAVMRDLEEQIMPGITHWQSPSFFGYFPCNSSFPAMLADIISSGLGSVGFTWAACPAYNELEKICTDWLAKLLRMPACFLSSSGKGGGALQNSGSEAVLVALLAAKARALRGRPAEDAVRLVAYGSDQTHSCVQKACMIAGIIHYRQLPTRSEDAYSMQASMLEAAMQADLEAGLLPCYVCATIGTTSSCAVDPVAELAPVAHAHGAWLHVDASWAGTFSLLPEVRGSEDFRGLELVDSYNTNPHKALLTNFGVACMWVRDVSWVKAAMSLTPEYLRAQANDLDYKDWEIPLGSRFRALKLWFVLRMYGAESLRRLMRHRLALQDYAVALLRRDGRFELAAPPRYGLLCVVLKGASDAQNAALLERLNASGKVLMVHTQLSGRYVLRFAIGTTNTQAEHVAAAWALISQEADVVLREGER